MKGKSWVKAQDFFVYDSIRAIMDICINSILSNQNRLDFSCFSGFCKITVILAAVFCLCRIFKTI